MCSTEVDLLARAPLSSGLEASGFLVGPAVFKTDEGATSSLAGSIPVRLRSASPTEGSTPSSGQPTGSSSARMSLSRAAAFAAARGSSSMTAIWISPSSVFTRARSASSRSAQIRSRT